MTVEIVEPASRHRYEDVEEVIADGMDGAFGLLPNHIDFAAVLASGLLTIVRADGEEYAAVDRGVLTKVGENVEIATPRAVVGRPLGELREAAESEFVSDEQHERRVLSTMTKIQTDMARKIFERDRES
jgi:F-type H+-transporting ATPase subunit epsilon